MAGSRGNGEGSIYQRTSDGRWLGVVTLGQDGTGRVARKAVSAKTRAEVVRKLKKLQRDLDDGLPAPDTKMTVAQLLTHWHDDVLRHQVVPSTVVSYWTVARHHIIPTLGSKRLANLTSADVDRLLSVKLDSGLSVSTVRRIRYILAQAIDQGIRWGSVNRNVARLSRAPKEYRREGRTLTYEQARRLLKELEGHRHEALYSLMLSTGLRRGEALGLQWRDFDEESRTITVRRQLKREGGSLVTADTKTARSRRSVNIPLGLQDLIMRHQKRQEEERYVQEELWSDTGFIFTTRFGTPIDPRNLNREFATICKQAGLEHWHPHELRHSAASLMLASGVKIQVVSEVLGHASIRMTADVYGHIL
ncbi:MAG TPA: tyrosine-type recombinase/integrase, partial [Acidimicrobiales bacterium]|nr:tyrosine-type recombinase/integrase [Acidimicrobiales bacterium]